ncbi:MAG: hypothetical protein H0U66_13505 [Gemmatimonadaceae bacterium]|nr:hypothetical protein [Gemmatimonadaceae bacterium]
MKTIASLRTSRSATAALGAIALFSILDACSSEPVMPRPERRQDRWNVAAERAWTVAATGESYKCRIERLASDEYISGFRVVAPHSAQTRVTLSVLERPSTTGNFDCSGGAVGGSEMVYAAGAGTDALEFPSGQGVHLLAGQSLLLVVHVSTMSNIPVSASTRIEARAGSAREMRSPIELFLAGTSPSHS